MQRAGLFLVFSLWVQKLITHFPPVFFLFQFHLFPHYFSAENFPQCNCPWLLQERLPSHKLAGEGTVGQECQVRYPHLLRVTLLSQGHIVLPALPDPLEF